MSRRTLAAAVAVLPTLAAAESLAAPRRRIDYSAFEEIGRLEGHAESITALAFSPHGRLLASGSYDTTVRIWEVATGRLVRTIEAIPVKNARKTWGKAAMLCVDFSPDGRRLATGSKHRIVRIWDVETGALAHTMPASLGPTGTRVELTRWVDSVDFSPDGRYLAACARYVYIWDVKQVSLKQRIRIPTGKKDASLLARQLGGSARCASYSPDGRFLAVGSWRGKVYTVNSWSGRVLRTMTGHIGKSGGVQSAVFSSDGRLIVSSCLDRFALVWDARAGEPVRKLGDGNCQVGEVTFSPDGRGILGAGGGRAWIWDLASGRVLAVLNPKGGFDHVAFSPDGRKAALSWGADAKDRSIVIWGDPKHGR